MKNTNLKLIEDFLKATILIVMVGFVGNACAADKITFYHYDLLGSPVATTNELGEVVWREEYSPYGDKLLKQDVGKDNVRGYTGHVHDEETGLTYMQARYYDAEIGRFMGVDPVGFDSDNTISFNRYAYGNDNPYKFVDPNGEAGKIATLVKLVGSTTKKMGRLTKEQAVQARLAGKNVEADTKQIAGQIERAAAKNKEVLQHKGHELKDGSKGKPHFQTEGLFGHTFWGGVGSALITTGTALEYFSRVVDTVDFTKYLSSGDYYFDEDGKIKSWDELAESRIQERSNSPLNDNQAPSADDESASSGNNEDGK